MPLPRLRLPAIILLLLLLLPQADVCKENNGKDGSGFNVAV